MSAATVIAGTKAANFPILAAWRSLASRPSNWWLLAAWLAQVIGLNILMNYGYYLSALAKGDPDSLRSASELATAMQLSSLASFGAGSFPFFGAAMAVVWGALLAGYDYTNRTAALVAMQGPPRLAILSAQTLAATIFSGVVVAITYVSTAVAVIGVSSHAQWLIEAPPIGSLLVAFGASWLTFTTYLIFGATLAVLFRSAAAALAAGLVWVLAVETGIVLLGGAYPVLHPISVHTLAGAASNLAISLGAFPWWYNAPQFTATTGEGWIAVGTLLVWLVASLAASAVAVTRRDL